MECLLEETMVPFLTYSFFPGQVSSSEVNLDVRKQESVGAESFFFNSLFLWIQV